MDQNQGSRSQFVSFSERPEWADVTPIPQDDGPHPVVPIAYTAEFREVMDYFRAILKKDERSERALQLTAEVIALNAANYTVWYFRRLVLEALGIDLHTELTFIESVANDNVKNYQLWHHRQWVAKSLGPESLSAELEFTEAVLNDDAKNYHAWAHRQFGGWETELDYCERLLTEDPYNNSAWNQRYFVISRSPLHGGLEAVQHSEVEYCVKYLGLTPDNESPWRYLRGLFPDKVAMVKDPSVVAVCTDILRSDPYCIQCLSFVLDLLSVGFQPTVSTHRKLLEALGATEVTAPLQLASILCQRLEKLDAIRARYWAWRNSMLPPCLV